MIKRLREDFSILAKYLFKHSLYYYNKATHRFKKKHNERMVRKKPLMEIILEYEGAKKLGGEFMGKRYILKTPVLFYRLRRRSTDGSDAFFYVGYINRGDSNNPSQSYQVVVEESWEPFLPSIKRAIETNEKAIIGIRKREGGRRNGNFKSRTGRRVL